MKNVGTGLKLIAVAFVIMGLFATCGYMMTEQDDPGGLTVRLIILGVSAALLFAVGSRLTR
jgi:hypothetical protein